MAVHPDLELLYPDIAQRGSLGAALQTLADEAGLSLRVTAYDADPLRYACVETSLEYRKGLHANAHPDERAWSVTRVPVRLSMGEHGLYTAEAGSPLETVAETASAQEAASAAAREVPAGLDPVTRGVEEPQLD
ncbi:hypothetical protein KDL01_40775 [Actinospica durhamensis]|uniref:Uncharacterized protein n=1 Tax=Actinospica durhamensis TaxID=1508375 RepID=A0A941EWV2_9ACTN|nr:hypothetical protein [Actinospica durhamensis]MBR7839657.1 hypothetical protein [Actinospica durhamensis]